RAPAPRPAGSAPAPAGSRRARRRRHTLARTGAAGLLLALGAGLTGCAQRANASGPTIELGTAYVGQPQGSSRSTAAYLLIRNKGAADKLVAIHSSAGGHVAIRGPVGNGPAALRDLTSLSIPAHSFTRFSPNAYHLVITDSGPMKSGTDITLTLTFAKAG